MIKLGSKVVFGFAVGSLLAAGCSSGGAGRESDEVPGPVGVGDPHAAAVDAPEVVASEGSRVRIEKTLRELDRGGDARAAKTSLEALIAEPGLAAADKDDAMLALSRAFEALGDEDAAIEAVEVVLQRGGDSDRAPTRDAAEKRLRFLLTGVEKEGGISLPPSDDSAPIASALADLFPADENGHVLVDIYAFGRGRGANHGVFEVAEAKRQKMEMDMSEKISVGQSISSTDSWIGLPSALSERPADMPQADRSMLIFYYDLGELRVPSRYDDYLPMPSDDIAEVLERGEGLVMAKKRTSGKPTIVIAAPRRAQLDLVEAAFSKMTQVPFEAVTIPLERKLRPFEIQATVRSARKELRGCYETALKTDKTLAGTVKLEFVIEGDGSLSKNSIGSSSTIKDPQLGKCLSETLAGLSFPAFGGDKVTVTYPLAFSP